jgi:hypothetical protein
LVNRNAFARTANHGERHSFRSIGYGWNSHVTIGGDREHHPLTPIVILWNRGARAPRCFWAASLEKANEFFPHETIRRYFGFLSQVYSLLAKLLKIRLAVGGMSETRSAHRVECLLMAIGGDLDVLWSDFHRFPSHGNAIALPGSFKRKDYLLVNATNRVGYG